MSKPILSQKRLRELFDYSEGKLFWKQSLSPRRTTGQIAGSSNNHSYVRISIGNHSYKAHRLIWKMFYGVEPNKIDHINHDSLDNRIENLRSVSSKVNSRNMKKNLKNKSGISGVGYRSDKKKWYANINCPEGRLHLGYFDTFEEAASMRLTANSHYGYHPNHGL